MSTATERIVHIMGCLYVCNAEVVIEIDDQEFYIFLGSDNGGRLTIFPEEIEFLEDNDIIERDGGTNGDIQEESPRLVFCLTSMAKIRIEQILKDKGAPMLNT